MLSFPSAVKIYLCQQATDMRKSFDSLAMLVQCVIKQDPLSGYLFVFRNKRGNALKLLYWDRDGYAIWYKALGGLTATRAATVQLSVPAIAALGGVLLMAEDVTTRLLIATFATLGGVWLVLAQRAKST